MKLFLIAPVRRAASIIGLLLTLGGNASAATVQTFSNVSPITINVQGNATPYPSNITVSGVPTTFTRLEVRLIGFSHTFPADVDILLVGPQGQRSIVMSDAGGGLPGVTGLNLSFAQTAPTPIPDGSPPTTGLFRPANYSLGNPDTFPSPGPGDLSDAPTDLFAFNGINPNGTWNLFVVDDASGDAGSVSGGWSLNFTTPTVFTVTKTADTNDGVCNSDCSLREALALAQNGDLVNFSASFNTPQSFNLLTALPDITRSITIQGTGANLLTVRRDFNAATEFRVFNIPDGVSNGVTISGMSIAGGNAGAGFFGGGIRSLSHLTLNNVHVFGNTAGAGGGVGMAFADGVFTNSAFSNNVATDPASSGGAINFQGVNGRTLRVNASTVSGNRSAGTGGGIANLSNSGNSRLEITNSTIANNSGGGLLAFTQGAGSTATTTLRSSIVVNNSPTNLATSTAGGGATTFQTLGFNLSDNYNGVFTPLASDITTPTPRLAPLALYGGQTPTHALLHASPAIGAGDASNATIDQRGVARVFGASADIGAVEMRPLVVLNANNGGSGSLRNILGGGGNSTLTDIQFENGFFSSARTITLTGGQLGIGFNANLIAPGANLLSISGNNNSRVFAVPPGIAATLSGMTITGGNGVGDGVGVGVGGGGIFNEGNLTLTHSVVTGNQTNGPNIESGGGIHNVTNATLTVTNSTISGNTAVGFGGGIFCTGATTLTDSSVSGNTANTTGTSGGIDSAGSLAVSHSTISDNRAPTGNTNGGGIISFGTTTITHSTITNNAAAGASSAGGAFRVSGTLTIRNSIIAGNVGNATQPDVFSISGAGITSSGFNLIGNRGDAIFGATGDQSGTGASPLNPLLGPLQNNGGSTNTHALLFGSPALDRGNSSGSTRDQTGQTRPIDLAGITNTADAADIGAFEAQTAPVQMAIAPTVDYNFPPGGTITFPAGASGTSSRSINVSSNGGVAPGSVNVSSCSATAGFTITNAPINLTGIAGGAQISGSILLSCTRGASVQSGTLSCSEAPNPGSPVARNWTLSCPAATTILIFRNGFE
ncbi:MAG: choice-of-anchor Q domain-containing protein [Pseudomarimonas sp.]